MLKYILPCTIIVCFFIACKLKHTTSVPSKPPAGQFQGRQQEPSLKVDPNTNRESQPFYNPSATRETDILHTKLDVRFDWAKRYLYGKATISARPYFYSIAKINLDARGMELIRVAEIKRNALYGEDTVNLKYEYDGKMIRIEPGRVLNRTDNFTLYIDYVAKPDELTATGGSAAISSDKGLYFINPDGKVPGKPRQIWTQGETQANSVWFPTVDRPNEKMTNEIFMTVDEPFVTLSNGYLASSKKNADGTRTDHWRMDLPHSVYLVMMTVGEFSVVKDSWRGKEVSYYVEKQFEPYAKQIFGNTPEMMEFFSTRLGVDYPWAKYSQICARDYVSGAMENTSATLHSDYLQNDDRELLDANFEEYVSHELFHQWFGDLVTCESWANLPLNESFATYGEYLWIEHKYGKDHAEYHRLNSLGGYLQESAAGRATQQWPGKREPLIRHYYSEQEEMFDRHSYNKGAQVLHLLRQYVGDEAFFASLKLYLETNKYNVAEIHDLRLAFEKITGQDLQWFFNQWFLSPGHPELEITYLYDSAKANQQVIVKQTQDRSNGTPVFRFPLSIDIYSAGKVIRKEVTVKSIADTFYFNVASRPDFVNVDAHKTLPCYKKDPHTEGEWAFLFDHSGLFMDRYEALAGLAPKTAQTEVAMQIVTKALDDKFYVIRSLATVKIPGNPDDKTALAPEAKQKLIALAESDPKSIVRTYAVLKLSMMQDASLRDVYLNALKDSSFNVVRVALQALVMHFPETGMAEAAKRENDPHRSMKTVVGNAYMHGGSDVQQTWFEKTLPGLWGMHQQSLLYYYSVFLKRCNAETVKNAISGLEALYNMTDSRNTQNFIRSILGSLQNHFTQKANEDEKKIKELQSVKNNATGLQQLEASKTESLELVKLLEESRKKLK
ncbi:MAG TPA: M1 family metallopeptidase [Bacteroidia bacterium]|nr:M1 family metallopeptidase [Bacteroidia bacterium]